MFFGQLDENKKQSNRALIKRLAYGAVFCMAVGATALLAIEYRIEHIKVNPAELSFKHIGSGTGITESGLFYSLLFYRSSDQIKVTFYSQKHASPFLANEELERMRRKASEVVDKGPVLEAHGDRVVGEKFTLRYRWGPVYVGVETVWSEGPYLYGISSRSPAHVEAFDAFYSTKGLP